MSNVMVTGGCGFIGGHLVDKLISNGHKVVVVDNMSSGSYTHPAATIYHADILQSDISLAMVSHEIEYVFHMAAHINLRNSFAYPKFDAENNIIGTLNVIQSAMSANVKKIIFASTGGAMYREGDEIPWTEQSEPAPQSPYALSKLCAEKYLQMLCPNKSVILRFSNVYGPRQNPHGEAGVIAIFMNNIMNKLPCKIFGDGKQVRDYVYVDDVVEACVLSMNLSGVFNVSTGIGTDLNTLTQMLISKSDSNSEIIYEPPRPGEMRNSILSYKKLSTLTDWRPVYLSAGLKKTVSWFKSQK